MLSRAFFGFSDLDAFVDNTALCRGSLRFAVSDGSNHSILSQIWHGVEDTMFVPYVR